MSSLHESVIPMLVSSTHQSGRLFLNWSSLCLLRCPWASGAIHSTGLSSVRSGNAPGLQDDHAVVTGYFTFQLRSAWASASSAHCGPCLLSEIPLLASAPSCSLTNSVRAHAVLVLLSSWRAACMYWCWHPDHISALQQKNC